MVFVFVVIWAEAEDGDGGSHFQETIANEFEPFVVLAHTPLTMELLMSMLMGVV